MLASASGATVVGFNVRPNAEARALAEREGVEIRTYRVIYQLTEDIEQALVGMLKPVEKEETLGEAEVRALFKVSRLGTIAGCMVTTGLVRSEEHTSELQSQSNLVCRLLLGKKKYPSQVATKSMRSLSGLPVLSASEVASLYST